MAAAAFIGVDIGTSGVRAVVLGQDQAVLASGQSVFAGPSDMRSPAAWWRHTKKAITRALSQTNAENVKSIAISATSGTVMAIDASSQPLPRVFMYSDTCPDSSNLDRIRDYAPNWSPTLSGSGGLSCALELLKDAPAKILHQADWINYKLTGMLVGDSSSALKSGYDPEQASWPEWIGELGFHERLRSETVQSGSPIGTISKDISATLGLPSSVVVVTGTTDGCASFRATGASKLGDGVTVLGTTLTIKLLSERPVFDATSGVYSHKIGKMWLAGGASNTGGGALLRYFPLAELKRLGSSAHVTTSTGVDYYPLPDIGERFPVSDADLVSRVTPRFEDNSLFLQGLLEGITRIEAIGYSLLHTLGAPKINRIFATGGGTKSKAWMSVRGRDLTPQLETPTSTDAAVGSALLALEGFTK